MSLGAAEYVNIVERVAPPRIQNLQLNERERVSDLGFERGIIQYLISCHYYTACGDGATSLHVHTVIPENGFGS